MLSTNSTRIKIKNNSTANNASNVTVYAFTTTSPLIVDTAAIGHFAKMNASFLKNIKLADPPISFLCPSGASIKSTHTAEFNFEDFPPHQRVHVFPSLASGSLLSIGQLCDFGCHAIFHKNAVQRIYNNNVILTGTRSVASNGLWIVNVNRPSANENSSCNILSPLPTTTSGIDYHNQKYFCNVLTPHNVIQERVKFFIATMGYPTKTTLAIAVDKGNLSSFPGALTSAQINKYYFVLEPSVKGHLTQERQGIQSTSLHLCSQPDQLSPSSASNDAFPARIDSTTNLVFATCFQCSGKIFGDPAGRFIAPSISGNNYINNTLLQLNFLPTKACIILPLLTWLMITSQQNLTWLHYLQQS